MKNFRDLAIRHLVDAYAKLDKELSTCIFGGTFKNLKNKDGELIHYAHIFEKETDWPYNLLQPYRAKLVEYLKSHPDIDVHTSAHHLDSSQMMCMNFFYPLISKGLLYLLLQNIDNSIDWGTPILERTQPEYISELEKGQEEKVKNDPDWNNRLRGASNIDFYIETDKGYKIYFEIKYTETNFDTKKSTEKKYQLKYEKIYKPLLDSSILPDKHDRDYFLEHYQLMRNLIHLQSEQHYVVFLVPQQNEKVWKAANDIKNETMMQDNKHCCILNWEHVLDIITDYSQIANDPQLKDYYAEFKKKYLDF